MSELAGARNRFGLVGRTALVTGCRRGIGKAIAVGLAEAGAEIVGVSATLEPDGGAVAREVEARGRTFRGYRADFADRHVVHELIGSIREDNPRIDVLVNNAGTVRRSPAAEVTDEDWEHVVEVNLNAQFVLTRELGREMLARGSGKVVFVASLLSFQGGIRVAAYAASKGAIAQLTKALANEWAAGGVNVNAVVPGYIRTDNTQALQDDHERSRQILERIPAGRWGEPEDIAGAVVFLASSAADYVHGTLLTVDGGWMSR